MSDKYFLDTNIIVYTFDKDAPEKRAAAVLLLQHALESGDGIISTQVIQEFLNVATKKFTIPMKVEDGRKYLHRVLNPLCAVYPDLALYDLCLEIQGETGYSFYDSLILAGGVLGGCSTLYTENMQDGQVVRGLTISNPF